MNSYVKIDRDILDWEWWSDINTSRLFFYMILKANWKDGNFKGINIPRGSFVSSVSKLSEKTNLTVDEVRTALKHLKSTNEITIKSYGKFTVFTINNYNTYQDNTEQFTEQIPSSSRANPEQIPSSSRANPEQIPSSSRANPEQIPSSSRANPEQIPSSSRANPEQIPSSSRVIPELFPTIEERKEGKKEKREERKKEKREEGKENITVSNETVCQTDVQLVVEAWNKLQDYGINPVLKINSTSKRCQSLIARIRQYGITDVLSAIERIKQSDFLQGKNSKGWVITFDWFVLPNNFPKVLEGNYDSGRRQQTQYQSQTEQMLEDSYSMMSKWARKKGEGGEKSDS